MKKKNASAARLLMLAVMILSAMGAMAGRYSVDEVPNVHVADRMRFVSNPDGVLSAGAVSRLDASLRQLRDSTSAEVVVVAVDDIDSDDPDRFATDLFGKWGLGKSDNDNGLLLLIVKDQRRAVIRTGYGLEGVLPDVACGRLLRNVMFPAFREGDYDGGTERTVEMMARVISDPSTAGEVMSKNADNDYAPRAIDNDLTLEGVIQFLGGLGCVMAGVLLLLLIVTLRTTRGQTPTERWGRMMSLCTFGLFACFLGLGVPLIAYLPTVWAMKRMRSKHGPCPNCGGKMHKLDEETDNNYLNFAQNAEEHLNSIDYDVWLCDNCGTTDIIPFVNRSSSYTVCPRCGARACTLARDRVIQNPRVGVEGIGEKTYVCRACHNTTKKQYRIAALAAAAPIIIGGLGGSGHGGGGSFGGGFGGGMTGGGGASGGW